MSRLRRAVRPSFLHLALFVALPIATSAALLALSSCAPYQSFDSVTHLRAEYAKRIGAEAAQAVIVPFEIDEAMRKRLKEQLPPLPSERREINQLLDYIFSDLNLRYSLTPTRDAMGAFRSREGNCLSFVNLFVGLARHQKLDPFYVEVVDYQRWNRREGMVVSQGHIVAGMYLEGELKTYDFLPFRPKAYRNFKPIDDLTAAAHFYNNLGAESLIAGDAESAERLLQIANDVAPNFEKAINNLGVVNARRGNFERALELYRRGLEISPDDSLILTNLARAYQGLGRLEEAREILTKVESINTTNPFFFIYESDVALARGDTERALEYLTRALRQDSEVPEVHLGFVKFYLAVGEVEKARHHLERALKLDSTNPDALAYAKLLMKGAS
jgi:tetratricopeptide (TPR) repeat protein